MSLCVLQHNSRIHLTRWAVTALAEKHRGQDHHPGLPGPRRPQPAGDANVRPRVGVRACVVVLFLIVSAIGWSFADAQDPRDAFDGCGELVDWSGCRYLYSYDQDVNLLLADFGGYVAGDTVHVVGTASITFESCAGSPFYWRLTPSSITRCLPSDLGCGVIVGSLAAGCSYWSSEAYGKLDLLDRHGFAPGDTVHVSGVVCWCGGQTCHPFGDGEIRGERLRACSDSLSAVVPLTWGRVRMLFR